MALPKYADIAGGADGTNGSGQHYKKYGSSDSNGNPGEYHIYADGHVEFVAFQGSTTGMSGVSNTMGANIPAPVAAPAAPPVQQNGGVEAPAAAPAPAAPAPAATASAPQQPDNNHQWQLNTQDGPHKNQWYYDELHQASDGSSGFFHVYQDGSKIYVPKTPSDAMGGGGAGTNSIQTSIAANMPQQSSGQAPDHINSSDAMHSAPAGLPSFNGGDSHETATVVASSSSIGNVNNADGLHNTSGFSGHASELHSSTPAADVVAPVAAAAVPADATASTVVNAAPAAADASPAADPSHMYTVVTGDNMWDIAQKHNMSLEQLEALNPQIANPELILPGQEINLGNGEPVVAASSDSTAAFPTTSSYDSTTTQAQTAEPHKVSLGGWSDGTSSVPHDPTHGIAAVAQANTDPLKINDNHQSA